MNVSLRIRTSIALIVCTKSKIVPIPHYGEMVLSDGQSFSLIVADVIAYFARAPYILDSNFPFPTSPSPTSSAQVCHGQSRSCQSLVGAQIMRWPPMPAGHRPGSSARPVVAHNHRVAPLMGCNWDAAVIGNGMVGSTDLDVPGRFLGGWGCGRVVVWWGWQLMVEWVGWDLVLWLSDHWERCRRARSDLGSRMFSSSCGHVMIHMVIDITGLTVCALHNQTNDGYILLSFPAPEPFRWCCFSCNIFSNKAG